VVHDEILLLKEPPTVSDTLLEKIINLCLSLDVKAVQIYSRLAGCAENRDLRQFWHHMAAEEARHVEFWKSVMQMVSDGSLPQIFDHPYEIVEQLESYEAKVADLLDESDKCPTAAGAFLTAYSLEIHLLHPVFETLFDFVRTVRREATPDDDYEQHLHQFLDALRAYGGATPELELLAETVGMLWKEIRFLVVSGNTDPLSQVLNRRGLLNAVKPLSHLAHRQSYNVGLMMIDIDDFKAVNDTHGHQVGDSVIRDVAGVIRSGVRQSDLVGRFGGEEFLVFLPEINHDSFFALGEKIRSRIEAEVTVARPGEPARPVTVSIGIADGVLDGNVEDSLITLIRQSDEAMYEAKKRGKNVVVEYGEPPSI
jgi:diguanylate cyclase (GGDEF)-like protein